MGEVSSALHIQIIRLASLFHNEPIPLAGVLSQQLREDGVGFDGALNVDPQQRARLRIKGGFLQLIGVYLAQALEPAGGG